ncbi:MAG: dethiobiotin synthetase [Arenicella sp.]|jgi:dethiobiotin synthetase
MSKKYIVAGIGTDVGKTVISAILVEKLQADYWKPIQAGDLENSDTKKIQSLTSIPNHFFHPETYQLQTPMSPHAAAEIDSIRVDLDNFKLPETSNNLIVELAGGLMVPLNETDLVIDLVEKLNLPVILISRYYLGSINHTLLSVEALQSRNIPIKGIIFNGEAVQSTKEIILSRTELELLGEIPTITRIDNEAVQQLTTEIHI